MLVTQKIVAELSRHAVKTKQREQLHLFKQTKKLIQTSSQDSFPH